MQNRITQARPYARAAFDEAQAEGALASWAIFLQALSLLVVDSRIVALLLDPRIERERLLQLLRSVCGTWIEHKTQSNYLELLVAAGRMVCAPEIYRLFRERQARAESISRVRIDTAYPLQPAEQEQVNKLLVQYFGNRVELTVHEDPELIGGLRIQLGDKVIDASVRGRLTSLTDALTVA